MLAQGFEPGALAWPSRNDTISEYLPVTGPWDADQMTTRAYVSQFSADCSPFVAAFQGNQSNNVYAAMSLIVHVVNVGSATTESLANVTMVEKSLLEAAMAQYMYMILKQTNYVFGYRHTRLMLTQCVLPIKVALYLFFSGSSDNLCKAWDKRCLSDRRKPSITFLESRGDGRYFISNGKN
ncbi:hypothetical protein ACH5RR_002914 [Cinchona calisaya]|uniref:Uncharacterized protein n=1 Tax=Cinchona calisaya TaxID=153742 RepID=A0ABD3ATN2_9GENT